MAPVVPFIPLIAAAATAGGGIISSKISANAAKKQQSAMNSQTNSSLLSDLTSTKKASMGTIPNYTSPLGDTSQATLSRGRLLG